MTITTSERDGTIYVSFPFDLKDQFKSDFPSAKWDGFKKSWTVTTRVRKRLEKWIEAAADAAKAAEEKEAVVFADETLERLVSDLKKIEIEIVEKTREIGSLADKKSKIVEMKALIEEAKARHADVLESVRSAQKASEEAMNELYEVASEIADIDKCISLAKSMTYLMRAARTSANRNEFDTKQSAMLQELRKLRAAGITSVELSEMINANFNRPDRDARCMTTEITFKRYEQN